MSNAMVAPLRPGKAGTSGLGRTPAVGVGTRDHFADGFVEPRGKIIYWSVFGVVAVVFAGVFLFPMFWAVTGALRSTTDLDDPTLSFLPHEWMFSSYANAWSQLDLLQYFKNTVIQAGGAWILEIVLLTLAAFALSKLRPRFGGVILGGVPGQPVHPGPSDRGVHVPGGQGPAVHPHEPARQPARHLVAGCDQRLQPLHPQTVL